MAAEITLFIDESHFKASITVAMTANVVMYTLYNAIQEEFPKHSHLKLIDIWLLHGLLIPLIVFIILAANELINVNNPNSANQTNSGVVPMKNSDRSKITDVEPVIKSGLKEDADKKKSRTFIQICRWIVPTISLTFMTVFIIIWMFG